MVLQYMMYCTCDAVLGHMQDMWAGRQWVLQHAWSK